MNIWVVSLYDPTAIDNTRPMRFLSLVNEAVNAGHNVVYFSNTFRHATKKFRFDKETIIQLEENYQTVFIESKHYNKNMSFGRLFSHYVYANNLIKFWNKTNVKPDLIVSALPPIHTNYLISKWAINNNVPYIIDIIDPWPEIFLRVIPKVIHAPAKLVLFPFFSKIKFVFRNASGIFSISQQYIDWASGFKLKGTVVKKVFYPSISYKLYQDTISKYNKENTNTLNIIYAGNLGLSYDIPCILKAAKILDENYPGKTNFVIAGLGQYEKMISEYMSNHRNIQYVGRVGQDELLKLYSQSDLGLAQYTEGATQSITYKFFDYLGSGLPILNSLDSEMAELLEINDLGLNNKYGDYRTLADNIVRFFDIQLLNKYKENAKKFTVKHGDSDIVYKEYINELIKVVEHQ